MSKGSLWVRYYGSRVVHRADLFPIPTDQIPERAKKLKRYDVREIWYIADEEWDPHKAYLYWEDA